MKAFAVNADVSGTVWKVVVEVGDTVSRDQDLVILESMKMEIPACAPRAGVVLEILVAHGDAVQEGQELLLIGPS
jgi:acetyl-CoA carboxylase biotin carboxyl carrier protein